MKEKLKKKDVVEALKRAGLSQMVNALEGRTTFGQAELHWMMDQAQRVIKADIEAAKAKAREQGYFGNDNK